VLVDGDNGFGDVCGMLDLQPERSIVDLARDLPKVTRDTLTKYLTQHSSGLNVLAAPMQTMAWNSVRPEEFRKIVELLSKSYDIVVVDTVGMLNELTLAALQAASLVLWVVTTEFASVRDSLRALEALRLASFPEERVRIVTNDLAMRDGVRANTIREVLGHEVFWQVPYDDKVRQDAQVGEPAVLKHPSALGARNLTDLARMVVGAKPASQGLFARLGLFKASEERRQHETTTKESQA
jgi:pilus assembly protein CpaE